MDWLGAELAIDHFELGLWDEALRDARLFAGGRSERGALHYLDSFLRLVEAEIVLARDGHLPARAARGGARAGTVDR